MTRRAMIDASRGYERDRHPRSEMTLTLADYLRSIGIGAVAGLRTFTAPAVVHGTGGSVWAGLMGLAAAGEYVGDKLPNTPSRLSPPAIAARLVSGGWCGGEVAARNGAPRINGIIAGATGAVAAAWLGFTVRKLCVTKGLPDFPIAVIEDTIALLGARAAAL